MTQRKELEHPKKKRAGGTFLPPVRTLEETSVSAAGGNANESLPAYQKTALS
jgi:hypothetical protein